MKHIMTITVEYDTDEATRILDQENADKSKWDEPELPLTVEDMSTRLMSYLSSEVSDDIFWFPGVAVTRCSIE